MFQPTEDEVDLMVSQNAIPTKLHLGGSNPFAFSEFGVLMLANVLRSDQSIRMSIKIIEVLVKMREMFLTHKELLIKVERIEENVIQNSQEIAIIFNALKKLLNPAVPIRTPIGYKISED